MAIYCIADTHFSLSVPKPMDVFGSRWQNYQQKLIKGWNSVVSSNDTVIVPGDISWGLNLDEAAEDLKLLDKLNGYKIISKGNHDLWWQSVQKIKSFFSANGIESIKILQNNAFLCEDKIVCGARGWYYDSKSFPPNSDFEKVSAREIIRAELSMKFADLLRKESGNEIIAFYHFPPVYKDFVCRGIIDLMHKYDIKRCYYGHIHGNYSIPNTLRFENIDMTIVSADYLRFKPYLIV